MFLILFVVSVLDFFVVVFFIGSRGEEETFEILIYLNTQFQSKLLIMRAAAMSIVGWQSF